MNVTELDKNFFSHCNSKNFVGRGSEGLIYKLDEKRAIKIYNRFKDIIRKNSYISTLHIEASEMYKEKLKKLIERRDNINKSTLPYGIFLYRGLTIGALLKYNNNHATFDQFYGYNTDFIFLVFKYLNDIVDELCSNYIYSTDLHPSNTLIDLNSDKVELIDFASEYIYVEDVFDQELYNQVYFKLTEMLYSYLLTRYNKVYGLPLEEHLESLKIDSDTIRKMLYSDVDYESFNEILERLTNNKTIRNSKSLKLTK